MATAQEQSTNQQPATWPVVYGYLRLTSRSPARRDVLVAELRGYCREHELTLVTMFSEYGSAETAMPPAFVGLLDVLSLAGSSGVVIPSAAHLGHGDVATARRRQIARTGAQLWVVRERPRKPWQPTKNNQRQAS